MNLINKIKNLLLHFNKTRTHMVYANNSYSFISNRLDYSVEILSNEIRPLLINECKLSIYRTLMFYISYFIHIIKIKVSGKIYDRRRL